jgi:hypothetical protein
MREMLGNVSRTGFFLPSPKGSSVEDTAIVVSFLAQHFRLGRVHLTLFFMSVSNPNSIATATAEARESTSSFA